MKTIYLDCAMGAAGDMLMGALLELHPEPQGFLNKMNECLAPLKVKVEAMADSKCGICGTHMRVTVDGEEETQEHPGCEGESHEHSHEHGHSHEHSHSHEHGHSHHHGHSHSHSHGHAHSHTSVKDVMNRIDRLKLPEKVKADAKAVYESIGAAESKVHGKTMDTIHFHEVGTLDALADVLGVCLLFHELGAEEILASPVNVGSGTVRCAHGILSVPAPATEILLRGIPIYAGAVSCELCTPTGAALLKHFVKEYGKLPLMKVEAAGYGTGHKDFPQANVVRAMMGSRV